jgi:hypothetical protein
LQNNKKISENIEKFNLNLFEKFKGKVQRIDKHNIYYKKQQMQAVLKKFMFNSKKLVYPVMFNKVRLF